MRYEVMSDTPYDAVDDLLGKLLADRGVNDVKALINVNETSVFDPFMMENMQKAVDLLLKHVKNENKICILIDEDVDGYSSATVLYLYLMENFDFKATYIVHNAKTHGIKMEELGDCDFDLLIVPDAGSNDFEEHKLLSEMGKDVIVLDHHQADKFSEYAVVVNPNVKGDNYPNKTLAGVGVVYKFCKAVDEKMGLNGADKYLDLVAFGCIGDVVDMRNLETRYLTLRGLNILKEDKELAEQGLETKGNKFLRAIVHKKKDRDLRYIDFTSIGWKVVPIANAVTRVGTHQEKTDMFRALIEEEEMREYQPRRKKKTDPKPNAILVTLQEDMVRLCTNIKARQDKEVKKAKEMLDFKIGEGNLASNKVIIVDGTDAVINKGLTGLIANKIAGEHNKPVLLLKQINKDTFGGSGRNFNMSPITDFRNLINDTNIAKGAGHNNAFGAFVPKGSVEDLQQSLETALKDVIMEGTHTVDYAMPVGRLRREDILRVGELKSYWGASLPEPKFAITNITVNVSDIKLIGERRNILKFKKGDHTFVKFFASQDYLDKMIMRNRKGFGKAPKTITMTVIGTFDQDEWNGKKFPQIIIQDFESKKQEEILF